MIPLWYTIFSSQSPFLFYTTCITPYHFLISLLIFFPMQFAVMVLYFWGILCFLQVYLLVKVQVLSCGLPQVEIKAKFESFHFFFFKCPLWQIHGYHLDRLSDSHGSGSVYSPRSPRPLAAHLHHPLPNALPPLLLPPARRAAANEEVKSIFVRLLFNLEFRIYIFFTLFALLISIFYTLFSFSYSIFYYFIFISIFHILFSFPHMKKQILILFVLF